jgi:hypothetical protein
MDTHPNAFRVCAVDECAASNVQCTRIVLDVQHARVAWWRPRQRSTPHQLATDIYSMLIVDRWCPRWHPSYVAAVE